MSEKESGQVSHILPLSQLPCANLQDQGSVQCLNRGDKACSKCRLVSYCSKECQQNHWKLHKSDCKNPLRSSEWVPTCDREGRPPSYPDAPTPGDDMVTIMRKLEINKKFSTGMWLWGNTPAVDLLNLQSNEGDSKRDYNLLFAASGDLRNVIKTVNNLPENFSGTLNIVLNDNCVPVCCRNLTLLLILSTVSDDALAADDALHFWFSVFLPEEYRSHVRDSLNKFIDVAESSQEPFRLTPSSTLTVTPNTRGPLGSQITEVLKSYQQPAKFAAEDAIQEIHRRREDPQWNDFRETRLYFRLRPSHRVAFRKARHTGLVLPFGASSKAFKAPNSSLFTPTGGWLLTAEVDPLHGWNLDEVVAAGKRHCSSSEDVYGCLYFFLSEQLRTFAKRLSKFRTSFNMIICDAKHLPDLLTVGELSVVGLSPEVRFDRIAASNILDKNYMGLKGVLTSLGPLLARSPHSTLVGYSLNWDQDQKDAQLKGASQAKVSQAMTHVQTIPGLMSTLELMFKGSQDVVGEALELDAELGHENSQAFSQYLKNQGLQQGLKASKLRMKSKHTILPYRIGIPIDSPHTALPNFSSDDSWYFNTRLSGCHWLERFMEFSPADV